MLDRIALGIALFAATVSMIVTGLMIFGGYLNLPFWDQWGYVTDGSLWRQPLKHHNEHLILIPRLFFIVDAWLGGRQIFDIASIIIIQVIEAVVLAVTARLAGAGRLQTLLAFLICLSFTLSACQGQNFVWGFQVQFVLVFAAFTTGTLFALLYATTGRRLWWWASAAAGLVSACSMANGLLAAPLLAGLLACLGRKRSAAAMLGVAAVAIVLYWIGPWSPSPQGPPLPLLRKVPAAALFGLTYLGAPFAAIFNPAAQPSILVGPAQLYGLGVAALAAAGLLSAGLGGGASNAARLTLAAVILFGLASAGATSWGRVSFGAEEAFATRYATTVMTVLSASWLALWLGLDARKPKFGPSAPVAIVVIAAAAALIAIASRSAIAPVVSDRQVREPAMVALAAGASDKDLLSAVTYAPDEAVVQSGDLRRHHRSLFAEPWTASLGKPLLEIAQPANPGACEGTLIAPQHPTEHYSGQVWAPPEEHPTRVILLTDASGVVMGFGRVEAGLLDLLQGGLPHRRRPSGWVGVVSPSAAEDELKAYLLLQGGRKACLIGREAYSGPRSFRTLPPAGRTPLELVWTQKEGGFAISGANPEPGPAPDGLTSYGSWVGADANTGTLSLDYKLAPGVSTIALPVVTGPDTAGEAITFKLMPSGRVIGVADLRGLGRWGWERLQLPQGAAGQILRVQVEDNGAGWGEWIAVGPTFAVPNATPHLESGEP